MNWAMQCVTARGYELVLPERALRPAGRPPASIRRAIGRACGSHHPPSTIHRAACSRQHAACTLQRVTVPERAACPDGAAQCCKAVRRGFGRTKRSLYAAHCTLHAAHSCCMLHAVQSPSRSACLPHCPSAAMPALGRPMWRGSACSRHVDTNLAARHRRFPHPLLSTHVHAHARTHMRTHPHARLRTCTHAHAHARTHAHGRTTRTLTHAQQACAQA